MSTVQSLSKEPIQTLTNEQKGAIGLLSAGTFLEYFDLMLYVHMAVFLNEIFFPKTDPSTQALLTAFAFCSTYVLRPIGALFFGYIGDNIGRKSTVIITTFMMATSCIIMANLPTYAQIGISAAYIMTFCRVLQGLSSMGEAIGAEVYLTETVKPPLRNVAVASISIASIVGGCTALGFANLVIHYGLDWRIAFWIGAIIAVIGMKARTKLRETPEFANAKKRLQDKLLSINQDPKLLNNNPIIQQRVSPITLWANFFIECSWPACFYLKMMYLSSFLVTKFGYSGADVIAHNFIVYCFWLFTRLIILWISYYVHPLKILKYIIICFSGVILFMPYMLNNLVSPLHILMIQFSICISMPTSFPAIPIFLSYLPVFRRFTYSSLIFGMSRSIMTIITSFGVVILVNKFGYIGLYIIFVPIIAGFMFGIAHFTGLERKRGLI